MWETDTFYEICFQQNVLRSAKNREIGGRRALLRKAASMITVNRCGYDSRHTAVLDSLNPRGNEDYTLLLIKTESFFEKDGKYTELPPNTGLLYGRHSYVHYGCRRPDYNDDWIHFELHGEDEQLLSRLSLPLDTPFALPYLGRLSELCRLVVTEKLSGHPYRQQTLDSLMRALLYSLASQLAVLPDAHSGNKYYQPMNELRMEIQNAPYKKWSVEELAERMHLSISHFQHLYREFFGTSCIRDVIDARIAYAQYYLTTTEMSIQALAVFCGYESELHFMRQFKKYTGLTPSGYREESRRQKG